MTIHLRCPNPDCQQVLRVADEHVGDRLACPACQHMFQVPIGPSTDAPTPTELSGKTPATAPPSETEIRQSSFARQLIYQSVLSVMFLGLGILGTYVFVAGQEKKPEGNPLNNDKNETSPRKGANDGLPRQKDISSPKFEKAKATIAKLQQQLGEARGEIQWRREREGKLYEMLALKKDFREFADWHALRISPDGEKSIPKLVANLTAGMHHDEAKVRAVFRWITEKIEFDVGAFESKEWDRQPIDRVFQERKGICSGYADLFQEMCQLAKIECELIYGVATGPGFDPKRLPNQPNHVWNAVKIDGQWKLIDATRGAGVFRKKKYQRGLQDFFYFPDPDHLIFTQFPKETRWQLTTTRVTKEQFAQLTGLQRPQRFLPKGLLERALATIAQEDFTGFVRVLADIEKVDSIEAPLGKHLRKGQTYRFHVETTKFEKMALVIQDKKPQSQQLIRFGDRFYAEITVTKGPVLLAGLEPGAKGSYSGILEYEVE
ncbi:MAG: transglutaminase domain-containing protein [Gemmataceae bacterium]